MKTKEEILIIIDNYGKLYKRIEDVVDFMIKGGLIVGYHIRLKTFGASRDKENLSLVLRDYYGDSSFDKIPLSWVNMSDKDLYKAIKQERKFREEKKLKEKLEAEKQKAREKEEKEYAKYLKLKEKYE